MYNHCHWEGVHHVTSHLQSKVVDRAILRKGVYSGGVIFLSVWKSCCYFLSSWLLWCYCDLLRIAPRVQKQALHLRIRYKRNRLKFYL